MAVNASVKKNGISQKTKNIVTIILLLLTLFSPLIGIAGVVVMWYWTTWKIWVKILITIPITLLLAIPIAILGYIFFFRPFQVNGVAMTPTYKSGEYLMTSPYTAQEKIINRNDVVVFKDPTSPDKDFIKRVIALPGESVMLQNGDVYINGQKIDESQYVAAGIKTYGGTFLKDGQTITVPAGQYFVLGDNRVYSSDSRTWGLVPQANFISKVSSCFWNCK